MKNYKLILPVALLALSACSQNTMKTDNAEAKTDSTTANEQITEKGLYAKMYIQENIKAGDTVALRFTVFNPADTAQQFCKWHTPFEPLISKYLDITDEKGEEVAYKGAMAKRIMPPPASAYLKVNAGDSLSVSVDLLKGYAISKPAKYKVVYVGQNMSGLIVKDSVYFNYK
ncbi:MAG: protease [Pedobacter sp.]|nr:MAG: protease [Pedobacter sp.]